MKYLTGFLVLLLLTINSEAGTKRSGASTMQPGTFGSCLEIAVLGRNDEGCTAIGESPACAGLKRSLELSDMKTECLKKNGTVCEEWGHEGRSQAEWVSIAAAHLGKVSECIRMQYGNQNSSGLKEARDDPSLIEAFRKMDDGGKVFKLQNSALLIRSLEGEKFGTIIRFSPIAKDLSPQELYRLQTAGDNPARITEPKAYDGSGSNPMQEGDGFVEILRSTMPGLAGFPESDSYSSSRNEGRKPGSVSPGAVIQAPAPPVKVSNGAEVVRSYPAPVIRPPSGRFQPGPYSLGLDRTIFERVSSAYQRNELQMRGPDDYIRTLRIPPPKDLGELLSRGGTL